MALQACLVLLLLGLVLGFRQYETYRFERDMQTARIDRNLGLVHARSDSYLERLVLDAEFIAKSSVLQMYLLDPAPEKLRTAQETLLLLASLRPYLDQVRYIDQQGMERIRIDQRNGSISLSVELQDKSDRDYVKAGLALDSGAAYLSDVDLNIEFGQIERPFRPVLRVVFPVNANGRPAGLVVLNAKGDELIKRFQMIMPTKDQQLVVLNSAGGWIMGGGNKDWMFAVESSAREALLSAEAPALWAKIQTNPSSKFEYQGQCHYYHWYEFDKRIGRSPRLLLAERIEGQDCDYMARSAVKAWASQLALISLFIIPLIVLWHLARARARELQRSLSETSTQLELVTREIDLALVMVDHQCRVRWINPEAERLLGWKAEELVGENLHERIHDKNGDALNSGPCPNLQALQAGQRYHIDRDRIRLRSGDFLNASIRVSPYRVGEEWNAIVTITDIQETVAREKRLTHLATTDPLTGVLNRRSLMEYLQFMVDDPKSQTCVLMADIDFFKNVNDTYGHAAGDQVLKNLTETIHKLLRKRDVLGRIGGEEFLVVLENTDIKNAQILAERLRISVANSPTKMEDGAEISITVSFGLALHNGNESIEALIARADAALYRAKHSGRNRVETAPDTDMAVEDKE